jgi:NitT/TauT family transport system permease protein
MTNSERTTTSARVPSHALAEDVLVPNPSAVAASPAEMSTQPSEFVGQSAGRRPVRRGRRSLWINLTRLGLLVGFFGLWQLAVDMKWLDQFLYGSPSGIASKLHLWLSDGTLFQNLWATFFEAGIGFAIAVTAAVPIGMILARSPFWDRVMQPFIDMANATPRFALAPLFVLLFGLGRTTKVFLVISIVFFIMLINTLAGVKAINEDYIRLARVSGATRFELFVRVILPATGGFLVAGLRLSAPYALAGAVVGEMLSGSEGLGYLVVNQSGLLDTAGVLAAVLILAVVGGVLNQVVTILVKRTPWVRGDPNQRRS